VIGVSGEPPDPATEFATLDSGSLKSAWLSGAIHPISLRGLVGLLLAFLPKETLGDIGSLFTNASSDDDDEREPQMEALVGLSTLAAPGLDEFPNEPIVSINPAASGRQIEEAATNLLKEWKTERGLSEQRDRSDKYAEYLQVWDMREGWRGGSYDRSIERTLEDIAAELKLSPSTVNNHYRRAFELIVGYPYSPDLWRRFFGILKLSELGGAILGTVSRRRPLKSPTRRPVPETIVTPAGDDSDEPGIATSGAECSDEAEYSDLLSDISSLIDLGRNDQQIVAELDLTESALPAIAYLRGRQQEMPLSEFGRDWAEK
jgi:hypothetical protein